MGEARLPGTEQGGRKRGWTDKVRVHTSLFTHRVSAAKEAVARWKR